MRYPAKGPRIERREALVRQLIVRLAFDAAELTHDQVLNALAGVRASDYPSLRRMATQLIVAHDVPRAEAHDGDVVLCVGCYAPIVEGDGWVIRDGRVPLHTACELMLDTKRIRMRRRAPRR